jgi:predicted alpha/beta-fold hydrolase
VVKSRFPNAPLGLLGASLGANMVIKYLGEEGDKTPVKGAVTIGSPYDMLIVDRFMNRSPIQKVWNFLMTGGLKEYAEKNREPFGRVVDRAYLMASKTVHEFDDRITRVIGKYEVRSAVFPASSSQFLISFLQEFYRVRENESFVYRIAPSTCLSPGESPEVAVKGAEFCEQQI